MKKVFIISLIFILLDQLSKLMVVNGCDLNNGIVVIPSFFSILYVKNYGAAFSLLQNWNLFLVAISFLALIFIYFYFIRNRVFLKKYWLVISILIGGVFGNLIDRLIYGYVIDFLSFEFFGWSFPIFNIADVLIVGSVLYMVLFIDWSVFDENSS